MRPCWLNGYDALFMNLMLCGEGSLSASKALTLLSGLQFMEFISVILPFS